MSVPTAESRIRRQRFLWRNVRSALRGGHYDYTTEPIDRAIVLLAAPMVLEMIMTSLFPLVSVFWVSRLGSDEIAVVGLTEAVMNLIYATAMGISIATTAIIGRRIGEDERERAAQAAGQVVVLALGISGFLGLVFGYFATDILRLMGATESAIRTGGEFARLMFGANVTVFMIVVINAILRAAGDAVFAMRTLWMANALHVVLCPCLVFGWGPFPELGLTGAAIASNVSRGASVLYQIWHLCRRDGHMRMRFRDFRVVPSLIKRVAAVSSSGIVQLLIGTASWIGLFKMVAMFGSSAVAGYTIVVRIMAFALFPAWGIASAAATLVGQNLGASRPDRAEAAVRIATRFNVLLFAGVGVASAAFSDSLARLFTTEQQVHAYAASALLITSLAFPLYAMGMCLSAAFNGAGDTWTPTWTAFACLWLGAIPLAWLLADVFRFGPVGVFIALPVSLSILAVWRYVLFRQGKWKQTIL